MQKNSIKNTCCFIGHRKIEVNQDLIDRLTSCIIDLIEEKGVYIFLFGSRSQFNDMCYDIVSKLREKYPHIKRVYVRAEYPIVSSEYEEYLLRSYEETFSPLSYLERGSLYMWKEICI